MKKPEHVQSPDLLKHKLQSLTIELLSVYEELSLLYSLASQIGRLTSEPEIGAVAIQEAMEISAADCGWVAFWDGTDFEIPHRCRNGISLVTALEISQDILKSLLNRGKNEFLSHTFRTERCISQNDAPARFLVCSLLTDGNCYGFLC